MLAVYIVKLLVEIVAHQRDGHVAGALDHAHAQLAQRIAKLLLALHIESLDPDTAVVEILLGGLRRHAKARPIGGGCPFQAAGFRDDVAAGNQPLQRFVYVLPRKMRLQPANDFIEAHSALGDYSGEGTIHLAIEQKFPVFGIEAQSVGR